MDIKNRTANIPTDWLDKKGESVKTVIVDGHKVNLNQYEEAEPLDITENGIYKGLFNKVTVDIKPEVKTQSIYIAQNGTYKPAPDKYIDEVTVAVFDTPFAEQDINWSEVLR